MTTYLGDKAVGIGTVKAEIGVTGIVLHDDTLVGNGNTEPLGVNTANIVSQQTLANTVSVLNTAIDAQADAISKTRNDFEIADQNIRADMNAEDSRLQTQITAQAGEIAKLDSEKIDKNQGTINAGKYLMVGDDGIVGLTESGGGGGGGGDTYTKTEIDNKILVINESIDAQADAISKTRDDMNEKDSELESMLNAHATELSTLRGNQATLGDQVSGIEANFDELSARVDTYSDTEFIARQVIASDRYIDLTLGTSGASYTAPADGWLVLNKLSSGTSYQYVQLYNTKNADRRIGASVSNSVYLCATMPLAKGDRVLVEYNTTGDTKLFRFIYANGAK